MNRRGFLGTILTAPAALAAGGRTLARQTSEIEALPPQGTETAGIARGTISAGAITTDKLYADTITADKVSVGSLSAISANFGDITR